MLLINLAMAVVDACVLCIPLWACVVYLSTCVCIKLICADYVSLQLQNE